MTKAEAEGTKSDTTGQTGRYFEQSPSNLTISKLSGHHSNRILKKGREEAMETTLEMLSRSKHTTILREHKTEPEIVMNG